jgi:hypothetical protein
MAAEHRTVHIITEALGIWAGQRMLSIARKVEGTCEECAKTLRLIGITTLIVDGFFIITWLKNNVRS